MSGGSRCLVAFDFDGTLADTWRDIATALNRTFAEAGLDHVVGPEVRFWIGEGVVKLLERAVPEPDPGGSRLAELYERFRVHYDECCLETTETYPGVIECLRELSEARLAIVSNKPVRFLEPILRGLDLKPYFDLVLGGDSLPVRKPDPAVLWHVAERLGGPGARLFMVGDSAVDVETGRSAGARTLGCAWGLRGREELLRAQVDVLLERPSQIPAAVLQHR